MSEYTENIKNISFMKGALIIDNHDESIIGYTEIKNVGYVYIYSVMSIIEELIDNHGMVEEEAWEYFTVNIEGSYVGERGPLFLHEEKEFSYYDTKENKNQIELPLMWKHYCEVESAEIEVGIGEPSIKKPGYMSFSAWKKAKGLNTGGKISKYYKGGGIVITGR